MPHTQIDGDEFALYQEVTKFIKRESRRAAEESNDPRSCEIGFLISLYQRRRAHAVRRSIENRARRLEEALKRAHELAREAPPDLPDVDELEEMDEAERERVEQMIEAVMLAKNNEQVRREVEELRQLAQKAQAVEASGKEAKLNALLRERGFFDNPEQRLLIFTEFKDTLDYLVAQLKAWGFRDGFIP